MKIRTFTLLSLLFVTAFSLRLSAQGQKVIFDSDLGGDIDDAFALALLLASPELDILGIVMDYGNTPERARVACRMLYETGREDIPVVMGRQTNDGDAPQYCWAEGFEKVQPIKKAGADFIIEQLRKYPDEVILITVGPVPNMADILEKDPDALKLAKHVYSMFGSFYMGYGNNPIPSAEWNVRADVAASQKFASSGAKISYAGLDVTTYVKFNEDLIERLSHRKSPLTDALESLYSLWGMKLVKPIPTLFDPVAVAMVIWPDLVTTRKAYVKVTGEGYTVIDESKEPNCEIGMSIDTKEFLDRLMDRLMKQNLMR
jgi:purine nucleosidase